MWRFKRFLLPLTTTIVIILIFRFVLLLGYVPTSSMEPTIMKDSLFIGFRIHGDLTRSDVVAFRRDGALHVKRIAAVPGDMVYINDTEKAVTINQPAITATRILDVPAGYFFVLGDNQDNSIDSRYWDDPFVLQSDIVARIPKP